MNSAHSDSCNSIFDTLYPQYRIPPSPSPKYPTGLHKPGRSPPAHSTHTIPSGYNTTILVSNKVHCRSSLINCINIQNIIGIFYTKSNIFPHIICITAYTQSTYDIFSKGCYLFCYILIQLQHHPLQPMGM